MTVSVTLDFATREEAVAFLTGNPVAAAAVTPAEAAPATPKAPRTRPAPAATPAAAPAPTPAAPPAGDLKKDAIAAVVKLINANDAIGRNGKQVCTDLCMSFGGANVSKIDPSKYGALIKAADEARAALSEDPAA